MSNILSKLPKSVINVLSILKENGYDAYVVGGAVRDSLLLRKLSDFDICSNAIPDEVRRIFLEKKYKVIETGIKHGTVTVSYNNTAYEVTTFRTDGAYLDNRHPEKVEFSNSLEEDLKRRDFTINAMACDIDGNVLDYHNGISDLNKKIIRTVGDPNKRFQEDALRMLRAIRFMACLKFKIDDATKDAILENYELIKNVKIERINKEVMQILDNSLNVDLRPYEKLLKLAYDYPFDLNDKDYEIISRFPSHEMKIAYLFNKYDINELNDRLNDLKISNEKREMINVLIDEAFHYTPNYLDNYHIKKYLSKYGEQLGFVIIQYLCYLNNLDILIYKDKINKLLPSVVNLKNLDLNGEDLIELGYSGKDIGIILNNLVDLVLQDKIKNERKALIKAINE